jgi:DNA-directed RNA polymerase subunit RPC12/RpoP
MSSLSCFLCGRKLEQRLSKRHKPYFVCDPCGIQLFIRRKQGIQRLNALFKNAEQAQLLFKQHAHNFYEIQVILKEIEDVKRKIDDIGFFFLTDEEHRTRKLLRERVENLFQQLEELVKRKN